MRDENSASGGGSGDGRGEDGERFIPMLRAHTIFHASQVDGAPAPVPSVVAEVAWRRPEAADVILRNSGARVLVGGAEAFYCLATDHIQLPPECSFESEYSWAATALHELAHWTGSPFRLNRDLSGRFGSAAYAEEELRADLASSFIGTELGLPCDIPNHASYVDSWLRKLRQDRREIFRAAAAAQRIADYCLAFHPDYRAEADAGEEAERDGEGAHHEPELAQAA